MDVPESPVSAPRNRAAWVLVLSAVLALSGVAVHTWLGYSYYWSSGHAIGSDDAYISYRYAHNLIDGVGLVFNPGERVEGYSNFLYTLLMAPGCLLPRHLVYYYSVCLNCACLLVTLVALHSFLRHELGAYSANAGALLLALNPWVWANAATGLETLLVTALTTLAWILVERHLETRARAPVLALSFICALSVLSRVDGFLLPLAIVGYAVLKRDRKLALTVGAVVLGVLGGHTLFRYLYYHDLVSNTFYAKVSGNLGLRIRFGLGFAYHRVRSTGLWCALVAIILEALRVWRRRHLLQSPDFASCFTVAWLAYVVFVGGDVYFERFLVALMPMGILLVLRQVHAWDLGGYRHAACVALVVAQVAFVFRDGRFEYQRNKYDCWIATGEFLHDRYLGASVAVDAAGKIPFFSQAPTIDMFGLNEKHIGKMHVDNHTFYPGHIKFDPIYVLSRKPDIVSGWLDQLQQTGRDLALGLTTDRYAADYVLRYVVNAGRQDYGQNIREVSQLSDAELADLRRHGFKYAILVRKDWLQGHPANQ
jgi:arabinofuranosyltransferase